jgi:hypothetical protein
LGFNAAGTRVRKKVSGKTKAEVRDKLRELHKELDAGLKPRRRYTVGDALSDWLAHGVDGLSERTVTLYRGTIAKALVAELGSVRLASLTALLRGVQDADEMGTERADNRRRVRPAGLARRGELVGEVPSVVGEVPGVSR